MWGEISDLPRVGFLRSGSLLSLYYSQKGTADFKNLPFIFEKGLFCDPYPRQKNMPSGENTR